MTNNLIEVLRDTQKLLDDRLEEIDILSGIARILTPSIDKNSFYFELSELVFSRLNVDKIEFCSNEDTLKSLWTRGSFDNEFSYKAFDISESAFEAASTFEVILGEESEKNSVHIPLLSGNKLFGVITLLFSNDGEISPFSRPFFYLLGTISAATLKIIDEWKLLAQKNEMLINENRLLKEMLTGIGEKENSFIFTSEVMNELIDKVEKIKNHDIDILINGESGTGKDLLARYIHFSSNRKSEPLISVNCAAIPESLVEGELFGIEEGVATGVKKRKGKFEIANNGTIFLDEVGELPLSIQAKLLRLLQEKKVTPVGSDLEIELNLRVVAATNRKLEIMVRDGKFREDLYYRLNNFPLYIPALRERVDDILPLFLYFFKFFCKKYDRKEITLSDGIEESIKKYPWPGNVRELKNRVLQAVIMLDDYSTLFPKNIGVSGDDDSKKVVQSDASNFEDNVRHDENIEDIKEWYDREKQKIEKKAVLEALKKAEGVKKKAAEILDISPRSFHYKFKELNISKRDLDK